MRAHLSTTSKLLIPPIILSVLILSCSPRSCIEERRAPATGSTFAASNRPPKPRSACYRVTPQPDSAALRQLAAKTVSWRAPGATANPDRQVRIKLLGFNDFHGQVSGGIDVDGRTAGGAPVLAAYLKKAMAGHENSTVVVHAGDLVGASPPPSALLKDEPSIAFLNLLTNTHCTRPVASSTACNVVAAMGNHELDEGVDELRRLLFGGNSADGPFLERPYTGARFPVLGANVLDAVTGRPLLPSHVIVTVNGVRIGFIGAMLQGAARYLLPSGIRGIRFAPVEPRVKATVEDLKAEGIHAIVLVMHEGGHQRFPALAACGPIQSSGPIVDIVRTLDGEVDVVVSGHTHSPLNIHIPNHAGRPTLVTQAFKSGSAFADIDLVVDSDTGDIVGTSSKIVTTWADEGPGLTPDVPSLSLATAAADAVRDRSERIITEASKNIERAPAPDGQSLLGNLIADAQRTVSGTDIAFVNPAWIRTDIEAGPVTWGDLFAVQPFENRLMILEMNGRQIKSALNQQRISFSHSRTLAVSGLTYTWDASRPTTGRVVDVTVKDLPLDPQATYTVTVNEFLAEGGEDFSVFTKAAHIGKGMLDIEALAEYLSRLEKPLAPALDGRIRQVL
jgi:5'-nucleotidase